MSTFIITASISTDSFAEAQEFARALGGDTNEIQFILGGHRVGSDAKCETDPAAAEEPSPVSEADAYVATRMPEVNAVNPNYTTFGINVYESDSHAFALGKKLYRNAYEAAAQKTRNGNWVTSFDLRIDLSTGAVWECNSANEGEARYFAVTSDGVSNIELSRGYSTASEARVNNPGALTVVEVETNDNNETNVRGVHAA